jgi:hypothetical protein
LLTTVDMRRARKQLRRLAPLALVVALAGCSQPGKVTHYNDQTQSNYVDACVAASNEQVADLSHPTTLSPDQAQALCTCWYTEIVTTIPFDTFKSENDAIRNAVDQGRLNTPDDFRSVAPRISNVVDHSNCVAQ